MSIKWYAWYFPVVIMAVALIGIFSTVYTYERVNSAVKESLLEHVSAIASALEPHHIVTLSGSASDLSNPDYLILKERLEKIQGLSSQNRFVYLTGYRDGNPFFYADSEPVTSSDYSPPGQVYSEADASFRQVFVDKKPVIQDVSSDRWGTWLTALAPIIDPDNGAVVAVLGVDVDASLYYQTVYVYSALPAVAASFVALLIIIGFLIRKREQKFIDFKSELVSVASHDIRTPLTGISWQAESLLRTSSNLSSEERAGLELINSQSRGLLVTINYLLDLLSFENLKKLNLVKKNIPAEPFFRQIIENFHLAAKAKSLEIVLDSSIGAEAIIWGEEDRVRRMFNNLVSNAVKYSKVGGVVTIGRMPEGRQNIFWVKDQGIGIPKKDQPKIFEGFFRTENAKHLTENGTGLGLRYVKQVSELHGGKVWCESEENVGSTFFVQLPRSS